MKTESYLSQMTKLQTEPPKDSPHVSATRVLIADDHQLLRDAIATPLTAAGFDVELSADYASTLKGVRERGPFDILLLDVNMPGMDGMKTIKTLMAESLSGSVVLFSGAVSPIFVARALEEGVSGFIPKSISLRALENALRLVEAGETFVPYSFFEKAQMSDKRTASDAPQQVNLTDRELRVLHGASMGQSNKQIALDLDFSEMTVKMHMRAICRKLGAKNRTQAAMIAKQIQII